MHIKEMPHDAILFRLLDFKLRQKLDKPFEGLLVAIDPEKVHLLIKKQFKYNCLPRHNVRFDEFFSDFTKNGVRLKIEQVVF